MTQEEARDRLTRLSEASLRINESLDFDEVLQQVVDGARALTGARYGVITTMDDAGLPEDVFTSGITDEERGRLAGTSLRVYQYFAGLPEPLRVPDFLGHARSQGLSAPFPLPVGPFLLAPIRHRGEGVGNIYLAREEGGPEFSREDEETLVLFASQAALVIANARRHRDERRARADLEALVNTAPVGVLVFDAGTGCPVSVNQEARRIIGDLHEPHRRAEELLDDLTVRRDDGREFSLQELSVAQALSAAETVRAEEITLTAPDGRSVTALINATPIRGEDGEVETCVVTLQDMTPLEELERLRAEFLAMVSHELRTPLATVKGSVANLLDPRRLPEPGRGPPVFPDHRLPGRQDALADQRPARRGAHRDGHALGLPGADGAGRPGGRGRRRLPGRRAQAEPSHRPPAGPALGDGGQVARRAGPRQPTLQRGAALAGVLRRPGDRRAAGVPRGRVGLRRRQGHHGGEPAAAVQEVLSDRGRGAGRRHRPGAGGLQGDSGGPRRPHMGR